jgi:hypothetical protein
MSADAANAVTNWTPWIAVASAVGGGLIVAVANHFFTKQRDLENEKRKIRIQYLIEAYRRLEAGIFRRENDEHGKAVFEAALADIYLLGSLEQIQAIKEFNESATQIDVVNNLKIALKIIRDDLRHDLNLPKIESEVPFIRFKG